MTSTRLDRQRAVTRGAFSAAIGIAVCVALGAAVSRAQAPAARGHASALLFEDTFAAPSQPGDPDYGLNAALSQRQHGSLAPVQITRLSGVWFDAPPAANELVRVGEPLADGATGRLVFHGFAAVRFDAPITVDRTGTLRWSATVDPVVRDVAGLSWVSFILSPTRDGRGWVTNDSNVVGVLIRSNGEVGVWAGGVLREIHWAQSPAAPANGYNVSFALRAADRQVALEGRVNEATFRSVLAEGSNAMVPPGMFLEIGAHYHPADTQLSVVSALEVRGARGAEPPPIATPAPLTYPSNTPEPDTTQGPLQRPTIAAPPGTGTIR